MAAHVVKELPEGDDWIYELKLDDSSYSAAVISRAATQTCGNWGSLVLGASFQLETSAETTRYPAALDAAHQRSDIDLEDDLPFGRHADA